MSYLFNPASPPVKLTPIQKIAAGIRIAALCFPYFTMIFFVCARTISPFAYFDSLRRPRALLFLRDQYDFLLARGMDQISAVPSLRIFELLIWMLSVILFLRVVSSPFLFGLVHWRDRLQARGGSIVKALFGWLLMAGAVWASTDIRSSSSAVGLGSLLERGPQAYICLEVFIFSGASILFVEGPIALCDFVLTSGRKRKQTQGDQRSEWPD